MNTENQNDLTNEIKYQISNRLNRISQTAPVIITVELDCVLLQLDERLINFTILKKPSSNVDYFGLDMGNNSMYVQFKSGNGSYIYTDVPDVLLSASNVCASIGKFISSTIIGNYPSTKFDEKLIKVIEPTPEKGEDEPSF